MLYDEIYYPEEKIEVFNKNIVDILTMDERSAINKGYYDTEMGRKDTNSFAINYAWRKGDRSPVIRGFQWDNKLYEIDLSNKVLLLQPVCGSLFYDQDKIIGNEFVFEGLLEDFVTKFIDAGYTLKKK
jgi:hypothetical protein